MLDRLKMAPEEGGEDEDDVATPSCELEDDRVWTLPSDMDGVSDGLCALVVGMQNSCIRTMEATWSADLTRMQQSNSTLLT